MTKVQKISNKTESPVAAISLINDEFNQIGLAQLIDTELGNRGTIAYSYSEIIRNYINIFLQEAIVQKIFNNIWEHF
jgi:hypothetical protein